MNIDASIKFKNNYRLQHIDTITGEILHDLEFHNVVLDQIIDTVLYRRYPDDYSYGYFGIAIGDGSGTPSRSDTALFHETHRFSEYRDDLTGDCIKKDNNTLLFSVSLTIPAELGDAYNISEVGVCFGNRNSEIYATLVTHALILDSEGNPIIVEKKDTDKIILDCELYITFESEGIENFNVDNFTLHSPGTLELQCIFGAATSLEAQRVCDRSTNKSFYINCPSTYNLSTSPSWKTDSNAKTITANFDTSRLPEFSMPTYIRGITFGRLGTIKLPNENIFPRYKVSDIIVGTGDGETTEFKCPLNYFIEGTETIYVGADDKIRDIDYTIDNEANQDELIELSAGNEAIITGGSYTGERSYVPLFRKPFDFGERLKGHSGYFGPDVIDASHPLFLDFREPVKLNTLRVPLGSRGTFTLSGRNAEKEDWKIIGQFTPNEENNHYNFDLCSYRVIKLDCTTEYSHNYGNSSTIEECKKNYYFIGYVGEGIKFTTPPSDGAVITMSAFTDLPFVSPNNVLDISATLKFHF